MTLTETNHRARRKPARAVLRGKVEARRSLAARSVVPVLGILALLLTLVGLSGVGDAPAPHDAPASMSAHFQAVKNDILIAAPIGELGAVALAAFVLMLARRIHRSGEALAATAVASAGLVASAYFLFIHVVYTSLAYAVAATSPETTKALFILTILAVPVLALATAVTLGAAAYGAARAGLPRWWSLASTIGAAVAVLGVFSYARSDFFSPDVQQQTVGGVLQLWVLLTTVALVLRDRRGSAEPAAHARRA